MGGPAGAILQLTTTALLVAQAVGAVRVATRLIRTMGGPRIIAVDALPEARGTVSAIVPVLNERSRLAPCLDGLLLQGPELREILVVDGGSTDGTRHLVRQYEARDCRIRLVETGPIPQGLNGKAWGLQAGLKHAGRPAPWLLTVDADVRPRPRLVASLLAHASRTGLAALSIATEQELSGPAEGLIHPALLVSLVYRKGIPGQTTRQPSEAQANGQCMLIWRQALEAIGGFTVSMASPCDDVTVARALARAGWPVGFFESDGLVSVRMYEGSWDAFINWTRSLTLRDQFTARSALVGLAEVALVQALPLPILLMLGGRSRGLTRCWLLRLNLALLATRLGILVGVRRAYGWRPWTFWLSPLFDVPAVIQLWRSALSRRHRWRGRMLVTGTAS